MKDRDSNLSALHHSVSLFPLETFCGTPDRPAPDCEEIDGSEMPEPYRSLLVHDDDMTPTLERFYESAIHLRLLDQRNESPLYHREVVLMLDATNKLVEYGAIRIHLNQLPEPAQALVLEAKLPMGTILAMQQIDHLNHTASYLRLTSTPSIEDALDLPGHATLYGRRNIIHRLAGTPLAEVLEILPP